MTSPLSTTTQAAFVLDEARSAELSGDGRYRYNLARSWGLGGTALWVMCNPSTADGTIDDQTIRRCRTISKRERCGSLEVRNLFAYRATDIDHVADAAFAGIDVVGPANHMAQWFVPEPELVICAWGAVAAKIPGFDERVALLHRFATEAHVALWCLGTTAAGHPRHPARTPNDISIISYSPNYKE